MADRRQITGDRRLDADLGEFFALLEDAPRLARAEQAISDQSLTPRELHEAVPPAVIRLAINLLDADEEDVERALPSEGQASARDALKRAIEALRERFGRVLQHPVVVSQLLRDVAQRTSTRDTGENRITGIGWEAAWSDERGRLAPIVLLRLRGESQRLLLATRTDWDDLTFLLDALSRVLRKHMEKSRAIGNAKLLYVADADKIGERLGRALSTLNAVRLLCETFGIEVKDVSDPGEDGDTGG